MIKFVVHNTQPINIIDKPVFLNLIRLGLPKSLSVMCSKTLKTRLNSAADSIVNHITKALSNIEYKKPQIVGPKIKKILPWHNSPLD